MGLHGALHALQGDPAEVGAPGRHPLQQPEDRLGDRAVVAVQAQRATLRVPRRMAVAPTGHMDLDDPRQVEAHQVLLGVEGGMFRHGPEVVEIQQQVRPGGRQRMVEEGGLVARIPREKIGHRVLDTDLRDNPLEPGKSAPDPRRVEGRGREGQGQGQVGPLREGESEVVREPAKAEALVIEGETLEPPPLAGQVVVAGADGEADAVGDEGGVGGVPQVEEELGVAVGEEGPVRVLAPGGLRGELEVVGFAAEQVPEQVEEFRVRLEREADSDHGVLATRKSRKRLLRAGTNPMPQATPLSSLSPSSWAS